MPRLLLLLVSLFLAAGCAQEPPRALLVLSAASLQEALNEAADRWESQGNPRPTLSFAASSALARQIEGGAKADLFVSADEEWMDAVVRSAGAKAGSRRDIAGNSLVLIGPAAAGKQVALTESALAGALGSGRLAIADPNSVPAGRYGKAALEKLGLWQAVANRLAPAENVRAALALVERGEAPLGVVYATDARASKKVAVVASFPAASHPPIVYPAVVLKDAGPMAQAFLDFLASPPGQAIFAAHGFTPPPS